MRCENLYTRGRVTLVWWGAISYAKHFRTPSSDEIKESYLCPGAIYYLSACLKAELTPDPASKSVCLTLAKAVISSQRMYFSTRRTTQHILSIDHC